MTGGLLAARLRLARFRRVTGALALFLCAPASQAQVAVDEIAIAIGLASDAPGAGWFFLVEVQGSGLVTGAVTPPVGGDLVLTDGSGSGLELEFEAGPFVSFAAAQAAHSAGDYRITVNGSHAVTLVWAPSQPLGAAGEPSLAIDSPAHGSTGVGSMPDVAYTLDCTNCDDLSLELESFPAPIFGFGQLDAAAFLNPIPFAAMELRSGGSETELPEGPVDAELLVGLVEFADRSFDPPSSLAPFEYIEAAVVTTVSTFTVPEPGAPTAAAAALAALGFLVSHRRRRLQHEDDPNRSSTIGALGSGS